MVVFGPQIPMYQHPPGRQAEYAPDGTPITPPRDRTTEVLLSSFCSVCLIRERKRTRAAPDPIERVESGVARVVRSLLECRCLAGS